MSNIWFLSDSHFGHKNLTRGVSEWFDQTPKTENDFNCRYDYLDYIKHQEKQKNATRDFPTVEAHNDYIIEQINKRVKSTDILWHLGDFGLGFNLKEKFVELRNRIKCENAHICVGNHDHIIDRSRTDDKLAHIRNCFKSIDRLVYKNIGGRAMVLCHYAMRTWPWQGQNSIQLFGHSHSNLPDDPNSLSMDVGVDTNLFGHEKYTPYSLDEIFHIMDNYKKNITLDHHL